MSKCLSFLQTLVNILQPENMLLEDSSSSFFHLLLLFYNTSEDGTFHLLAKMVLKYDGIIVEMNSFNFKAACRDAVGFVCIVYRGLFFMQEALFSKQIPSSQISFDILKLFI